jgi:hypothetical protein
MQRKFLLPVLLSLLITISSFQQEKPKPKATIEYVWVCESGNSVKYHKDENCSGLNKCSVNPTKTKKTEAVKTHDPCKICSKSDL